MEMFAELAKYGATGVAIASLLVMAWIVRVFLARMDRVDERHSQSFDKLSTAINRNTKVTEETYHFLQNLNGSLKKVVKEKQK